MSFGVFGKKPADQSQFVTAQESQLPPPEMIKPPPTVEELRRKKHMNRIIVGGLLFILMLVVLLWAMVNLRPAPPPPAPPPTPTITHEVTPSALETELLKVDSLVEAANPHAPPFEPPPVDMEVKF